MEIDSASPQAMMFSLIQILLVLFALFAMGRVVIKARQRRIPTAWAVLLSLIWVALVVVSLLPQTTDLLAAQVGIGRGADLLVYLSIIGLFYLLFRLVVHQETLQQDITKVVRAIALKDLDQRK